MGKCPLQSTFECQDLGPLLGCTEGQDLPHTGCHSLLTGSLFDAGK